MPWKVVKQKDHWNVVKESDNSVVTKHDTKKAAEAHLRALYANVPEARKKKK